MKCNKTVMTPELKARLESVGLYRAVCQRRARLVKEGERGDLLGRALLEVAPDIASEAKAADVAGVIKEKIESDAANCVAALSGKRCSVSDAVEWAFVKCSLGSAKVEDAPSDVAWAMYLQFKKSPMFLTDMAKAVFSAKVKKDGEKDTHGADGFDGDGEYNVLAAMGESGGGE